MQDLTPEGLRLVEDLAKRHGTSREAVLTLLRALVAGNGTQAQFNHPELGGMGQWSQGGMIMVGDMFNEALKSRVATLCRELAVALRGGSLPGAGARLQGQAQVQGTGSAAEGVSLTASGQPRNWWPDGLGSPASVGAQNDLRYAYFPLSRRLAIKEGGVVRVYDTADHRIAGFSQQQGGGQSLTFTSQHGLVRVADLALVAPGGEGTSVPAAPAPGGPGPEQPPKTMSPGEILSAIERLAELRSKDILTEAEFAAKKAELLARL